MEFDASGQEYRWMAVQSGDEVMQGLCMPGEKPHAYMGAKVFDMDYQEFKKQYNLGIERFTGPRGGYMVGKVANLSLQYRTSWRRLRSTARTDYDIPMTEGEAQLIHGLYPQTYPRIPIYWSSQIDLAKRQGYVETLAGRRVKIIGDWRGSLGWSMGSTAINYAIQGTGGDQKYLALACLKPYIKQHGIKFLLDMHDGLLFDVPDEKVRDAARQMKQILDTLPYSEAWGIPPLPVPMVWDCKVGRSWGQLADFKE